MNVIVNGEKIDVTLEDEKNLGQVLQALETEFSKNNATTIGLKVNGEEIREDKFDQTASMDIEKCTDLELTVLSSAEVKEDFLKSRQVFQELSEKLKEIPVLLQSGKDPEANHIISILANEIDHFCHTATLSALFPETYQKLKVDGKALSEFFQDFAPILNDFKDALENKDTVTIGDLSEYEISPRLENICQAIELI